VTPAAGQEMPEDEVGGRRRLASLQRREDIISAAAERFAERGYHAVGMREIGDAVAIRSASVYNHFASKEEILYAICLRVTEEPVSRTLPLLDAPGTPAGRLAALVRGHILHLAERRVEHLVGLHELAGLSAEHRQVIDGHRRHYQRRVEDVIAAGVRAGELDVEDVSLATLFLLDSLNGFSHWYRPGGPLGPSAVADHYAHLAIRGLLQHRPTSEEAR
jgi:AcrR family transcriptional regulator